MKLNIKCVFFGHDIKDKVCIVCGDEFGLPKIKENQFPVPKKKN
jgi:hypothetical protein